MDLEHIYWILRTGRPKHKATIYDLRSDLGRYIKEPVFFLSTGRCGTRWFADLLKNDRKLSVFHDPLPSLASQSKVVHQIQLEKENDQSNKEERLIREIFLAAREQHLRYTYKSGKRYVETNNYITFFADVLVDLFPDARFIHLVRHPGEFIRSGISRNYYDGGPRDQMRPVPVNGKFAENWDSMQQYEKVAWLWLETNRFIDEFKTGTGAGKVHFLNINHMDLPGIIQLNEFLKVDLPSGKIQRMIPKRKNTQQTHSIGNYSDWSDEMKESVRNITGKLAESYGYSL